MRTETVEIYTFSELDDDAQERAIERYREISAGDYAWGDEWRASLEAFAAATGITIKDWEVSTCGPSYVNWTFEPWDWRWNYEPLHDMRGLRLRAWLINNWLPLFWRGKYYSKTISANPHSYVSRHSKITGSYDDCPFTGYCGDCPLIDPVMAFVRDGWKDERTDLEDIINDCFHAWCSEWEADMEWQSSDECIRETIEANEYEFYSDGSMA